MSKDDRSNWEFVAEEAGKYIGEAVRRDNTPEVQFIKPVWIMELEKECRYCDSKLPKEKRNFKAVKRK